MFIFSLMVSEQKVAPTVVFQLTLFPRLGYFIVLSSFLISFVNLLDLTQRVSIYGYDCGSLEYLTLIDVDLRFHLRFFKSFWIPLICFQVLCYRELLSCYCRFTTRLWIGTLEPKGTLRFFILYIGKTLMSASLRLNLIENKIQSLIVSFVTLVLRLKARTKLVLQKWLIDFF